ncbi:MAG TPA: insulinase family protein, partial [Povalibacter sp.]|nr:insulinase family protein [Povalibacter sp.]
DLNFVDARQQILTAYAASQAVAVLPWTPQPKPTFAYTDFGPPGKITYKRYIEDVDATLIQFENGVRLNLKPTRFKTDQISINVRLGSGRLAEPPAKPGLARLTANVINGSGLGRHSAYDLNRFLIGKTASLGLSLENDAWAIDAHPDRRDLLLQLQLMCAQVTDPGYRPEGLRQYREDLEHEYAASAHGIAGPLVTEVLQLLANGDQRFGFPDKDIALSYSLEDARAWMQPQLASAPIEIAMVGDFVLQDAIDAVARTFGTLPQRQPEHDYAARRKVSFPRLPMKREYTVPTQFDRAMVQLRWAATDELNAPRARRFYVLAEVLKDRLNLTLREKYGDTYSPHAWTDLSDTYPNYGYIIAQADVAPSRAHAVLEAMKAVALELAQRGVTEDELQRVKAPFLANLPIVERRNDYWAGPVLGRAQTRPERLDYYRNRIADYQSISVEEINALAAQYLRPERLFEAICLPATLPAPSVSPSPRALD